MDEKCPPFQNPPGRRGCGEGLQSREKPRACRDLAGGAGLPARVPGRDTANDIHMWGVNLRSWVAATQFSAPHPHRSPSLQKKKCRAVVWQPRRLPTAPVDRAPPEESGMRACVSAPAPAMRAAPGPRVRTGKKRCHAARWSAHAPLRSEAARGGAGERGMLEFPGPAFSPSGSTPRGCPTLAKALLGDTGKPSEPSGPARSLRPRWRCLPPTMRQLGALARLTHSLTGPVATWKPVLMG